MSKAIRTSAAALVAAFVVVVLQQSVLHALGPTVLMFYGGTLKQPVYVSGPDAAVFDRLNEPSNVPVKDVAGRPFINVALFWGNASDPANNGVRVITDLKPDMAWQHGRFYPGAGAQPAVLLTTTMTKGRPATASPSADEGFIWGGRLGLRAMEVLQRLKIAPR